MLVIPNNLRKKSREKRLKRVSLCKVSKVAVLIPVFNRENLVKDSITSILRQTHKDLDIIIYDDGSDDKTLSILVEMHKLDKRIRIIRGGINKGVGYARQVLLEACNTVYAVWHDSDDFSHPDRVKTLYESMDSKKLLVFSQWYWSTESVTGKWTRKSKAIDTQAFATIMFPVNKSIKFNEFLNISGEDWDWVRKMKVHYDEITIPDELYAVRFHGDRIGHWKKKIKKLLPKDVIVKHSYAELIKMCKEKTK